MRNVLLYGMWSATLVVGLGSAGHRDAELLRVAAVTRTPEGAPHV